MKMMMAMASRPLAMSHQSMEFSPGMNGFVVFFVSMVCMFVCFAVSVLFSNRLTFELRIIWRFCDGTVSLSLFQTNQVTVSFNEIWNWRFWKCVFKSFVTVVSSFCEDLHDKHNIMANTGTKRTIWRILVWVFNQFVTIKDIFERDVLSTVFDIRHGKDDGTQTSFVGEL